MYCSSTSIGRGCPYGPKNVHVHPMNAGKCIYCGSMSIGRGCTINPNGDIHVHGVDYNNMIKEALHNGIAVGLLMRKLSLPFIEWPAYKTGIINENGIQLKKPITVKEKASYTGNDAYIAKLKRMLTESQIELINNTVYLSNKKQDNMDASVFTEMYKQEIDTKQQIDNLINQLVQLIADSYVKGLNATDIEKMIIEAINSR